jgi:hypothetical protein
MTAEDPRHDETVRVTISGRGIDLTRDVNIALLPRLIALLVGSEVSAAGPTDTIHTERSGLRGPGADVSALDRPVGAVEYIREKKPQTSSDTILVLAAYLELHESRRPFGRDDLRRVMRIARLPEPANFPRDIGVAVSKGYIQPLDDGFQLTNTALELIRQQGPLVVSRGRGVPPRRAARSRGEES